MDEWGPTWALIPPAASPPRGTKTEPSALADVRDWNPDRLTRTPVRAPTQGNSTTARSALGERARRREALRRRRRFLSSGRHGWPPAAAALCVANREGEGGRRSGGVAGSAPAGTLLRWVPFLLAGGGRSPWAPPLLCH